MYKRQTLYWESLEEGSTESQSENEEEERGDTVLGTEFDEPLRRLNTTKAPKGKNVRRQTIAVINKVSL